MFNAGQNESEEFTATYCIVFADGTRKTFNDIIPTVAFIFDQLTATSDFRLIIRGEALEYVCTKQVPELAQVRRMDVCFDNTYDLQIARKRYRNVYQNMRFCLVRNIPGRLEATEVHQELSKTGHSNSNTLRHVLQGRKKRLQEKPDPSTKNHPNPVCEFCQQQFDSATSLDSHKSNQCEKFTVPCALKDYGCSSEVVRVKMSEHYKTEQHQVAIVAFIHRDLSKMISGHVEGSSGMDIDHHPHTTTSLPDNTNVQIQEVYETIDVFAGGIQALNEDTQRLNNEAVQIDNELESIKNQFSKLKLSVEEQCTYLDGVKPNQEILHQDILSLKQKLEDAQFISYDGTLVWKIPNFAEKMQDAQSERQTSIYSPPFYSSPTGYKMRGRLYLNGDGNARRTHMSLFFVLMRSEHDAILKFPFNYKVTFCLYDQSPQQRHIIDSFRPDTKSNSFQRPRSEMNIASGIPKFLPLTRIRQERNPYVKDDTIFIKIMVDFDNISTILLPYVFSLNLGLPTHIQQALIREESERQAHRIISSYQWIGQLSFVCDICFETGQYPAGRFCGHRPCTKWILTQAGHLIIHGRCEEYSHNIYK